MELHTGISGLQQQVVTAEVTADKVGSGTVKVFATPMMIARFLMRRLRWASRLLRALAASR